MRCLIEIIRKDIHRTPGRKTMPDRAWQGMCCHPRWGKTGPPAGNTRLQKGSWAIIYTIYLKIGIVRTVNHENIRVASRSARNIDEVDMILRKSHDGLVTVPVRSLLDIIPRQRSGVRTRQKSHVQGEELAL